MIAGSGMLHLAYFLLLDRAYRSGGDLSVVYPLARATGPLLTIVAATLFFGERMTPLAAGGALLIGISALILTGNPAKIFTRNAGAGVGFALLCGCMIASYTVWDKQGVALFLIPPVVVRLGRQPVAHRRDDADGYAPRTGRHQHAPGASIARPRLRSAS